LKRVIGLILAVSLFMPTDVGAFTKENSVPTNKEWMVTFSTKMNPDTINKKNIYVVKGNEKLKGINVEINGLNKVKITNPKGYLPGEEYTLIITKNVESEKGVSLAESVEKTFLIKNADQTKELTGENASVDSFHLKENKIYFLINDQEEILPKEELNPHLNTQIYKGFFSLLDQKKYTNIQYNKGMKIGNFTLPDRIFLRYGESLNATNIGDSIISYIFYENLPYNAKSDWQQPEFSQKVTIGLTIKSLKREEKQKLKSSLRSIFPENGEKIYEFALAKMDSEAVTDSEVFGDTQVDYIRDGVKYEFFFSAQGEV